MIYTVLKILVLAFIQNTSFSMVSRSRNRDNMKYHFIASFFSNTLWFLTMRELVLSDLKWYLLIPYALGTVSGSIYGAKLSMKIEKWLGASADGHLNKKH